MTPILWTWLLSLTAAGLFFAAGVMLAGRRFATASAQPSLEAERAERERVEREQAVQLANANAHAAELQARIDELTREREVHPAESGLRQELAMVQETLRSRDTQVEHLREENTRLRGVELELGQAKRELEALVEKTRELRAQAYVSKPPPPPRPRKPSPTISSRGRALQTIVDTETQQGGAKSAVIADELGLLVAASGASNEYNDALAALGAYLADVGTKTRDVLPLHEVRQVVVRDENDVTLTVRPLATDDPGLALVTLAIDGDTKRLTETRHN